MNEQQRGESKATTAASLLPHFGSYNDDPPAGLSTYEAAIHYESELTEFERNELVDFNRIYTVGSVRVHSLKSCQEEDGFYKVKTGEQIGYRYLVDSQIDAGAFGSVCKCVDMTNGDFVAVKLSRSESKQKSSAENEGRILTKISQRNGDQQGCVRMIDQFTFRKCHVIVFEMLDINLYRFIK